MEFKLGSKLKDKVSGVVGIAVSRTEFLNGCVRYALARPVDKEGKLPDEVWFDVKQLELVGKGVSIESSKTGGPTTSSPPAGLRS